MKPHMSEPVDAVVTWVDGNDPAHVKKRNTYLKIDEYGSTECAKLKWRFVEINEIKYCLYSIRKYAPWIRKIFLVTDDQCPHWLTEEKRRELRVSIIDHKVIFRDHLDCLPTFNVMSINTLLWRIPGLSERFVVLNDDCFFIESIFPQDLFIGDNAVLRGQWRNNKISPAKRVKRIIKYLLMKKRIKMIPWRTTSPFIVAARKVGYQNSHFETAHVPGSYFRSVIENYYVKNWNNLMESVKYRFRNKKQASAAAIFPHLAIKQNRGIIRDSSDSVMIIPDKRGLIRDRYQFEKLRNGNSGIKFLCFQDLAYLKEQNPRDYQEATDFLDKTILS